MWVDVSSSYCLGSAKLNLFGNETYGHVRIDSNSLIERLNAAKHLLLLAKAQEVIFFERRNIYFLDELQAGISDFLLKDLLPGADMT